jgi:hypothetical protein
VGLAGVRDRPLHRADLLSYATRSNALPRALVVLRAAAAVAAAAGLTAVITRALPRSLDVRTDIVGYPIHSNFNVNRYVWVYALWAVVFPVLALAIELALSQLTRRWPRLDWTSIPRSPDGAAPTALTTWAIPVFRVAFLGAVFGLAAAISLDADGPLFVLVLLIAIGLYTAVALVGAAYAAPLRDGSLSFEERLATLNLFAAPLSVLGLYGVSKATQMRVLDSGNVYEYPWFPAWLAVLVTVTLLAIVGYGAYRAATGSRLQALERRSLLLVAGPVLLFLVLARLPGEIGAVDSFHEGELMAAADLTADGAVPWRDLVFVHGFLHDVVAPLIGLSTFEDTRWGYYAGALMIVTPVYFISQYVLFAYLFGRNVLFLAGTQLAVVLGLIGDVHFRFVLMPFALLFLAALLRRPSWPRAAGLAAVLVVQAVLSPETTIAIPAFIAVLGLFELFSYDRTRPLLASFRRTTRTLASGTLAVAALFAVFAALRVLDDFVFIYRTFISDHVLTGGIPVRWVDNRFRVAAIAPVAVVIATIWFFATAWRTRKSPRIDDWMMAGLALTVLLYYPKFLARADFPHLYQVFAVAVPLLAYALYRTCSLLDERPIRLGALSAAPFRWATAFGVIVVALISPTPLLDATRAIPGRVSAQAHFDPVSPRLGFLSPNATSVEAIEDIDRILDAYLGPDGHVFDFSNNPLLFHYLLDRRPTSRYFHVSMASREHTQSDLIDDLERRKPPLIVFSSAPAWGLPRWDSVSNQVRHYWVSEYLLDRYRPLLASHSFVFMARKGVDVRPQPGFEAQLHKRPVTDGLYLEPLDCDWGYAPNFLEPGPAKRDLAQAIEVPVRAAKGVFTVTGWAADLAAKRPAQHVVAALGSSVYGQAVPSIDRPEVSGGLGDPGFTGSGFTMIIPATVPLQQLRFYGLTRGGTARELVYSPYSGLAPRSRAPGRVILGGRSYRVIPGGVHGWAETAVPEKRTFAFDLPVGRTTAGYDWIEIRAPARFVSDRLGLTDTRGEPKRTIWFNTLDRGHRSLRIHVGACSQWHGLRSGRLYLESGGGQTISHARLIP